MNFTPSSCHSNFRLASKAPQPPAMRTTKSRVLNENRAKPNARMTIQVKKEKTAPHNGINGRKSCAQPGSTARSKCARTMHTGTDKRKMMVAHRAHLQTKSKPRLGSFSDWPMSDSAMLFTPPRSSPIARPRPRSGPLAHPRFARRPCAARKSRSPSSSLRAPPRSGLPRRSRRPSRSPA